MTAEGVTAEKDDVGCQNDGAESDAERMTATSYYNVAVASFNLSQKDQAREYAGKVLQDEQFGERAREILSRLK